MTKYPTRGCLAGPLPILRQHKPRINSFGGVFIGGDDKGIDIDLGEVGEIKHQLRQLENLVLHRGDVDRF
jgi:hypothetical protein